MLQIYQYSSMTLFGVAVVLALVIATRVVAGYYETATTRQLFWAAFWVCFVHFVLIVTVKWQYAV